MEIRPASTDDLPAIVRLLADDPLGAQREGASDPLPSAYGNALEAIAAQAGNQILVAVEAGAIIGCLQLILIPGLSRLGMSRAQIEGVRVDRKHRGRSVGEALIRHAIAIARQNGCGLVQLTSDKTRQEAHRFYERLGFVASHEGMKLALIDEN